MKVNPGDLQNVMHWLRMHGHEVAALAKQGDREAQWVETSYRAFHADKLNVAKQDEVIRRVKTFMARQMTVTELVELQRKFGYRVEML